MKELSLLLRSLMFSKKNNYIALLCFFLFIGNAASQSIKKSSKVSAENKANLKDKESQLEQASMKEVDVVSRFNSTRLSLKDDAGVIRWWEAKSVYSKVIDWILKVFNIFILLWIYLVGRNDRKTDLKRNVESYWYQDVVLKSNHETMSKIYDDLESMIEKHIVAVSVGKVSGVTAVDYDKLITDTNVNFNDVKTTARKKFIDIVEAVHPDLADDLNNLFMDLQDSFSPLLEVTLANFDGEDLRSLISSFKSEFISKLYGYHKKI